MFLLLVFEEVKMKRVISLCMVFVITILLSTSVIAETDFTLMSETIASGKNGSISWKITDDGTLSISGKGNMNDYSSSANRPWYDYIGNIKSVIIENGITSIGDRAFTNCSALTSITIPDSVTNIGNYIFYGCSSLTEITIPFSITDISGYAFYECSSLTNITIPDGVKSISNSAFYGCSSLTNLIIPDSVTSIDSYAFVGCKNLTSITIPDGVKSIGEYQFSLNMRTTFISTAPYLKT